MEHGWKKRYSFRLKKGDQELYDLLEGLADSKRSEAIRQMLLFACRSIAEEKKATADIQDLQNQMQELQTLVQKQHQELLYSLSQPDGVKVKKPQNTEEKKEQMTEQALNDSAAAMLSSFGIT